MTILKCRRNRQRCRGAFSVRGKASERAEVKEGAREELSHGEIVMERDGQSRTCALSHTLRSADK